MVNSLCLLCGHVPPLAADQRIRIESPEAGTRGSENRKQNRVSQTMRTSPLVARCAHDITSDRCSQLILYAEVVEPEPALVLRSRLIERPFLFQLFNRAVVNIHIHVGCGARNGVEARSSICRVAIYLTGELPKRVGFPGAFGKVRDARL